MKKLNLKKRWIFFFFLTVLAIFCLSILNCNPGESNNNQAEIPVNIAPVHADVLNFIRQELQSDKVPGCAIAIVTNRTLSNASGVGEKNHGQQDEVRPDTYFLSCSIAKMLTAGAVMTLVDEGKVDTDAPVTNYVSYFSLRNPFNPSDITVHHCLTHTSGIPDYIEVNCSPHWEALSRWFRNNTDFPLWSPPGRLWNYSNLGYSLAGLIVQEVSGQPFPTAMKQRIFTPAGMTAPTYSANEVIVRGNYAVGHVFDGEKIVSTVKPDTFQCALAQPPGFLFISAMDMAHFCEVLLSGGGDVLSRDSVNMMKDQLVDTHQLPGQYYGYGLVNVDFNAFSLVFHSGGFWGFRTFLCLVPEYDFGVVVMVNADNYDPFLIAEKAISTYLDLPEVEYEAIITSPDTWGIYTGKYNDPYELGEFDVYQDSEKRLWVNFIDLDLTTELLQISRDYFYFDISDDESQQVDVGVTFFFDDDGKVEYFATRVGVGKRVEADESAESPDLVKHLPPISREARLKIIKQKAKRIPEIFSHFDVLTL
ncbi:MAG: serine hydrolase [Candidatus Aminicenantes bacterium]|nr:MAG: serine hydrolase [Candidatus Aminicenantes bacterium]